MRCVSLPTTDLCLLIGIVGLLTCKLIINVVEIKLGKQFLFLFSIESFLTLLEFFVCLEPL